MILFLLALNYYKKSEPDLCLGKPRQLRSSAEQNGGSLIDHKNKKQHSLNVRMNIFYRVTLIFFV